MVFYPSVQCSQRKPVMIDIRFQGITPSISYPCYNNYSQTAVKPLGLAKFVRYNREFAVSEFANVVNMDFGTEKMGKICSL